MVVSTPNGNGHSKLTLENVLHVLSVSYMLVSLGALDSLGYCIAISGGHLDIQSSTGNHVAHIARMVCGLYQVAHEGEGGYAVEIVSVMELHRRMGHITPKAAQKLVEAGLVTGLALDPNSQEEHCEVCLYARATRKPVPKVQVSPQAKQYGDEIHTDIGGPTRVATLGGH